MVISNIIGGLGNQMFQYSTGRALALRKGISFKLDISAFGKFDIHQGWELARIFNCVAEIARKEDVRRILGWQYSPSIRRLLSRPRFVALRCKGFVVEPYFNYWPEILDVRNDCYLMGYWQSEKYFLDAAQDIRNDFTFKLPLKNRNAELAEQIIHVNAVSLHVRRGDYVSNPKTAAVHGFCSLDYYRSAIHFVSDKVKKPHFFIFSDDINWAQENLKPSFPCQFIDHNSGTESYNDMRLMSLCQHHIIANSSFSWWGAWLNPSPKKIVIAPKKWFASAVNVQDLLPSGWVKL